MNGAKLGKFGQPAIRLVSALEDRVEPGEILILCPFLAGLDPALGMWLGPLAWHDSNGKLIACLERIALPTRATVFAGVFCADPFRSHDDVLASLQAAGVTGVVNLPSVSFLDGDFAQTLAALNLGLERELGFLRHARAKGFSVAGCARSISEANALCAAGAELILTHTGPPIPSAAGMRERPTTRAMLPRRSGARYVALHDLLAPASTNNP